MEDAVLHAVSPNDIESGNCTAGMPDIVIPADARHRERMTRRH